MWFFKIKIRRIRSNKIRIRIESARVRGSNKDPMNSDFMKK